MAKRTNLMKQVTKFFKSLKFIDILFLFTITAILFFFLRPQRVAEGFNNYAPVKDECNFVLFYADWCPHCQAIKSDWNKLEKEMNGQSVNGVKVNVKKVHCPDNETSCKANQVESYPTIILFTDGQQNEYSGGRSLEGFKSYLNKTLGGQ